MNSLILNIGSSSVKYAIYKNNNLFEKRSLERIFSKRQRKKTIKSLKNHLDKNKIKINKIGHRVVHGFRFRKPSLITPSFIKALKKCTELAPLHEAPEIEVMEICSKLFNTKQFAVFDTGFFETLPEKAKIYGLPYKFSKKGIIRYGFHGISHKYVSKGLKGKVISCHLGNGCSISAIKNGKPVDTSMGFTPLEGLIMGTRSGSLDPAILPYLIKHKNYSLKQITSLLNKKSGLLGISGISNDLRDLLKKEKKNKRAKLAIDAFLYRIIKYIGKYSAALNGLNTLIFTAGIGERNPVIRKRICDNLSFLGIKLDQSNNTKNKRLISSKNSKIKVLVIPTDEESEIFQEIKNLK